MNTLTLVLTSSLIASIISALISAIIALRVKHIDYKNQYYREIIRKRLEAYQFIENQIAVLKTTVLDEDDKKAYHSIFSFGKDEFFKFQKNVIAAMAFSIWIDERTTNTMEKLNDTFYRINNEIQNKKDLTQTGKQHYNEIAKLRKELEGNVRDDLYNLHKLKRFFKSKTSGGKRRIITEHNNGEHP